MVPIELVEHAKREEKMLISYSHKKFNSRFILILSFALILFFQNISELSALDINYVEINSGILYLGNSDTNSAPSPILRTIGITLPLFQKNIFTIRSGINFWGNYYAYNGSRALPQEIEAPEDRWNWILATNIDTRFGINYRFNKSIEAGADTSLAFLLRFPIVSSEIAKNDKLSLLQYFFGKGRFFYPANDLYFTWNVYNKLALSFNTKIMYPLFHLWDGESLPFYDQLILIGTIGFVIRF